MRVNVKVPFALRAAAASAVILALDGGVAGPAVAQSSERGSGISIGGTALPSLRPSAPTTGFAPGAAGLPDAGSVIEREPPGSHGLPPYNRPGQTTGPQTGAGQTGAGQGPAIQPQAGGGGDLVPPATGWSDAQIHAAQARCRQILSGTDAIFTFVAQAKNGACGTPAPVELSGFGSSRSGGGLAVSPPVIVTCDIAAALHAWMRTQIQPLAKRHLGAGIIQINTMSSYSCRNRYGAKNAPLSQHAFANAVDVRGFITASGQLIEVEQHWGPTTKELAGHEVQLPASSGAAPDKAVRRARAAPTEINSAIMTGSVTTQAGTRVQSWSTTVAEPASPNARGRSTGGAGGPALLPAAVETAGAPAGGLRPTLPASGAAGGELSTMKIVATGKQAFAGPPPIQLGEPLDGRALFLRDAWQGACGPFTTVLGPEANRAHRNHLHIDLAQRKSGAFCQ